MDQLDVNCTIWSHLILMSMFCFAANAAGQAAGQTESRILIEFTEC